MEEQLLEEFKDYVNEKLNLTQDYNQVLKLIDIYYRDDDFNIIPDKIKLLKVYGFQTTMITMVEIIEKERNASK